ncbi:hypothetical protein U3516DRAFT_343925 [Neocallimastix sp. 'constans']
MSFFPISSLPPTSLNNETNNANINNNEESRNNELLTNDKKDEENIKNINKALSANKLLQQKLLAQLNKINNQLQINKEMMNCLNAIWTTQKEGSEPIFTTPSSKKEYFKDIDGEQPDEGSEAKELNKNKLLLKKIEFLRKWPNSQKKKLDDAVKQQIHKNYLDTIYEKAKQEGKSDEEAINIRRKTIEEFQKDSIKLDEIYYTFKPSSIDWKRVASVVEGRLPIECQSYWLNNMRPSLNRNIWTETERNKLLNLIKKYSKRNWIQIAKELNSNRVPFQCLQEYLRYKNKLKQKKYITPKIPYQLLRPYKGKRVIKPPVKWTPEEDEKLKVAVKLYGERWNKVCILIPGRTDAQCRERYKNAIDPQVNRNKIWSKEELLKLLELADMYAPNWSKIAKELNTGRTNRQVKNQFEKLSKKRKRLNEREAFYSNIVIKPYNLPNNDLKYNPDEAGKYGVKIAPAKPKPFIPYPTINPFNSLSNSSMINPFSSKIIPPSIFYANPFFLPSQNNLNIPGSSISNPLNNELNINQINNGIIGGENSLIVENNNKSNTNVNNSVTSSTDTINNNLAINNNDGASSSNNNNVNNNDNNNINNSDDIINKNEENVINSGDNIKNNNDINYNNDSNSNTNKDNNNKGKSKDSFHNNNNSNNNTNLTYATSTTTPTTVPLYPVQSPFLPLQPPMTSIFPKIPFMIPTGNMKLPLNDDATKIKKTMTIPPLFPLPLPIPLPNMTLGSLPLSIPIPKIPISNINKNRTSNIMNNGSKDKSSNKKSSKRKQGMNNSNDKNKKQKL